MSSIVAGCIVGCVLLQNTLIVVFVSSVSNYLISFLIILEIACKSVSTKSKISLHIKLKERMIRFNKYI